MNLLYKDYIVSIIKLFCVDKNKIRNMINENTFDDEIFVNDSFNIFKSALDYIDSFKELEESPIMFEKKLIIDKINYMIETNNFTKYNLMNTKLTYESYELNTKIEICNRLRLLVEYFGINYLKKINIKIINIDDFNNLTYDDASYYYTDCTDTVKYHLTRCLEYYI